MPDVRRFFALLVARALGLTGKQARSADDAADWDRARVVADLRAGKPLVVHVTVALCSNRQIDCGSAIAGWERLSLGKVDDTLRRAPNGGHRRALGGARAATCPHSPLDLLIALVVPAAPVRCDACARRASRYSQECWAEVVTTRAAITRLLAEHDHGKSPAGRRGMRLGPRAPPPQRVNLRVPEQLVMGFGEG